MYNRSFLFALLAGATAAGVACSAEEGGGRSLDAGTATDSGSSALPDGALPTSSPDASRDASVGPSADGSADAKDVPLSSAVCTFDVPIGGFYVHDDLGHAVSPKGDYVYVHRVDGLGNNQSVTRRYKVSGTTTCVLTLDQTFGIAGKLSGYTNADEPGPYALFATDSGFYSTIGRYAGRGVRRYWPPSTATEDCSNNLGIFSVAPDGKTGYGRDYDVYPYNLAALSLGQTCARSDLTPLGASIGDERDIDALPSGEIVILGLGNAAVYDPATKALVRTFATPNADTLGACGSDVCVYNPGAGIKAFQRYDINGTKKAEVSLLAALPSVNWAQLGTVGKISRSSTGFVTYVDKANYTVGIARVVIP